MAKYVNAAEAKKIIVEAVDSGLATTSDDLAEIIDDLPPANIKPVRHGQWEYYGNGTDSAFALCSECGSGLAEGDAKHFDYCPYCGAKMDLEVRNATDEG